MRARRLIASLIVLVAAACGREGTPRADSAASPPPIATPTAADGGAQGAWVASETSVGPLHIGMSVETATSALGGTPGGGALARGCVYRTLAGVPAALRLMWVDGRLARIDVDSAGIVTDRGVGVGDAATRIDSIYDGGVVHRRHKYVPKAQYLVIEGATTGDSARLVFETDSSSHVRSFRVGREPEVEWVEGCS